jgi:hypothetical protein
MSKINRVESGNYGICEFHQKLVGSDGKCSVCVEQETRAPKTEHRAPVENLPPPSDSAVAVVSKAKRDAEAG